MIDKLDKLKVTRQSANVYVQTLVDKINELIEQANNHDQQKVVQGKASSKQGGSTGRKGS